MVEMEQVSSHSHPGLLEVTRDRVRSIGFSYLLVGSFCFTVTTLLLLPTIYIAIYGWIFQAYYGTIPTWLYGYFEKSTKGAGFLLRSSIKYYSSIFLAAALISSSQVYGSFHLIKSTYKDKDSDEVVEFAEIHQGVQLFVLIFEFGVLLVQFCYALFYENYYILPYTFAIVVNIALRLFCILHVDIYIDELNYGGMVVVEAVEEEELLQEKTCTK